MTYPTLDPRLALKGHKTPVAGTYLITPASARELLERNSDNRSLSQARVTQIADDIKAGRWQLNGESIIIADDGSINDGQHRLWAILEADRPVPTLVVFGVTRSSRLTVDTGISRTTADILSLSHEANAHNAAAVAGQLLRLGRYGPGPQVFKTQLSSKSEVIEFYRRNRDEVQEATSFSSGANTRMYRQLGGVVLVAVAYALLRRAAGSDAARDFWEQAATGVDLPEGSPILYLRNRLMSDRRLVQHARLELVIRAWNAWREGRSVRTLPITGSFPPVAT